MMKNIESINGSLGYQPISRDFLQFENQMLFATGFARQKRIWVLGHLKRTQMVHEGYQSFDVVMNPKELFLLASFFLLRGFQASLERAKIFCRVQLCHMQKFFLGLNRKKP